MVEITGSENTSAILTERLHLGLSSLFEEFIGIREPREGYRYTYWKGVDYAAISPMVPALYCALPYLEIPQPELVIDEGKHTYHWQTSSGVLDLSLCETNLFYPTHAERGERAIKQIFLWEEYNLVSYQGGGNRDEGLEIIAGAIAGISQLMGQVRDGNLSVIHSLFERSQELNRHLKPSGS